MESKKCKICDKEKPLTDFYQRKDNGRYRSECKECYNERGKKQGKEWRRNNKEKTKVYHKKYYIENIEKHKENGKKWRENNKEYLNTPEKREKRRKADRERNKRRRQNPVFRLNQNLSRSMNYSLRNNNLSKNGKRWEYLVGYTTQDLKEHLEKLFLPGMSWKNYGKNGWEIDHIIPKDFFEFTSTDDVEFRMCWRLENLQPLWRLDNIRKSNKILRK